MSRFRIALVAIVFLAGAAGLIGCGLRVTPAGCVARVEAGAAIPGDWAYEGVTDTWWDPEDGFIGWAIQEDTTIWVDTHHCAVTDGAERWPTNEHGCTLVADQPGTPPPYGWQYWIEDDGDELGYWANQLPAYTAPRLAYSWGSTGDIWTTLTCAYSNGTVS